FDAAPSSSIPTLSLHDALPIFHAPPALDMIRRTGPSHVFSTRGGKPPLDDRRDLQLIRIEQAAGAKAVLPQPREDIEAPRVRPRSEEHTSELQSLRHLVCRLLL